MVDLHGKIGAENPVVVKRTSSISFANMIFIGACGEIFEAPVVRH